MFINVIDNIDALNLINSSRIGELYKSRDAEDPLVLRRKAADFRKGYKNWRQKKSKGARGETNYLLDHEKQHASNFATQELQIITEVQTEVAKFSELHGLPSRNETPKADTDSFDARTGMVRSRSFHDMDKEAPIHDDEKENWLKFYVNPYSGMAEATAKEPIELSQKVLHSLPSTALKPKYVRPSNEVFVNKLICHIGVGGFHRSHQCVYCDDLLNAQAYGQLDGDKWGFCGIGLMDWDRKMYEILRDQDYLYTVVSRGNQKNEARIIGSIVDYIFAPDDYQKCIDKLADSRTCIVSLTVTEKGYYQNSKGELDLNNPLVRYDIDSNLEKPKTAIGMIVAALRQRKSTGISSFTVLSCDNLPENGHKAKHCILQMAESIDLSLKEWILSNTAFPNTMVDRITPLTDQEHKDILARDHLIIDKWPVIAEDFSQWVIEDRFSCGRPQWEKVGALLVEDVLPYEFMKLRLLNGGHSALSYASLLCDYTYVDDAMSDPSIRKYITLFFQEVCPTLMPVEGVDISQYCSKLLERFANPFIKDKLLRLAEDGSKKMQNTMRDVIVELHKRGLNCRMIAFANAAWICFCNGTHEVGGKSFDLKDPVAEMLQKLAHTACSATVAPDVEPFLLEIHGSELIECKDFVMDVAESVKSILSMGAKAALESTLLMYPGVACE